MNAITKTLAAWELGARERQARKKILEDAARNKKAEQEEERATTAAQENFKQELRRLKVMFQEGLLGFEEHARLRAAARNELDQSIEWNRSLNAALEVMLQE